MFELIRNHVEDFRELGKVPFETEALPSGQAEKFAMLSEDQCYLALTYMRNSVRVRQLKVRLVKTFRDARKAAELREVEYKPGYHELHDAIDAKAPDTPNARFVHMNFNKLCNRVAGIEAGARPALGIEACRPSYEYRVFKSLTEARRVVAAAGLPQKKRGAADSAVARSRNCSADPSSAADSAVAALQTTADSAASKVAQIGCKANSHAGSATV